MAMQGTCNAQNRVRFLKGAPIYTGVAELVDARGD